MRLRQLVERGPAGDRVEPGCERPARIEAGPILPGPPEGVLRHVFRRRGVAQEAAEEGEEAQLMAVEQRAERRQVSPPCLLHECLVGNPHAPTRSMENTL